jgi:hypothetical protein
MKYSLVVVITSMCLVGCYTPEEVRQNQIKRAAMSPINKCIEQANFVTGMCQMGAMSIPNLIEKNRTLQQCLDRQMAIRTDALQDFNESNCD